MFKRTQLAVLLGVALTFSASAALSAEPDMQAQIDAIKAAIPKFAVPMREVGDRFQDMYFAAKGGNWALAAYMSKYMNGAMNPAALTKPKEYKMWQSFYKDDFAAVDKEIMAKNWGGFATAYAKVTKTCNECHASMDYGFIKLVKQGTPSDAGIDYTVKSEPGDVPK